MKLENLHNEKSVQSRVQARSSGVGDDAWGQRGASFERSGNTRDGASAVGACIWSRWPSSFARAREAAARPGRAEKPAARSIGAQGRARYFKKSVPGRRPPARARNRLLSRYP